MDTKELPITTEIPAKKRDLSARYGKQPIGSGGESVSRGEDVIPAINRKHPIFLLIISLGFAALNAELLLFGATYYGNSLGIGLNIGLIAGVFVISWGVIYASFILPHRRYLARYDYYSPIVFLVVQWIMATLMLLGLAILTLVAGIFLVEGRLEAIAEILRSLALYTLAVIILVHGLVTFVRYVRYLYERDLHESYKIVSVAGGTSLVLLIVILYLLQFDLGRMGGSGPNQGWLALHLTIRDIGLLGLTVFTFLWQATALADH